MSDERVSKEVLRIWAEQQLSTDIGKMARELLALREQAVEQQPVAIVSEDNSKMLIGGYVGNTVIPWTPKPASLFAFWLKPVKVGDKLYTAPPAHGAVSVRADVVAFLNGSAPLGNLWFGERDSQGLAFWWRKYLPDTAAPRQPEAQPK